MTPVSSIQVVGVPDKCSWDWPGHYATECNLSCCNVLVRKLPCEVNTISLSTAKSRRRFGANKIHFNLNGLSSDVHSQGVVLLVLIRCVLLLSLFVFVCVYGWVVLCPFFNHLAAEETEVCFFKLSFWCLVGNSVLRTGLWVLTVVFLVIHAELLENTQIYMLYTFDGTF